jgi:hypothetical protein
MYKHSYTLHMHITQATIPLSAALLLASCPPERGTNIFCCCEIERKSHQSYGKIHLCSIWLKIRHNVGNITGNNFVIGQKSVGHLAWPVEEKMRAAVPLQVERERERETLHNHKGPFSFSRLFNPGAGLPYLTSTGQTKWPTDFWPITKLFPMIFSTFCHIFSRLEQRWVSLL